MKKTTSLFALLLLVPTLIFAREINLPQASTVAPLIDTLYDFIFWMSVVFQIIVTVGLVVFVMKYHTSKKGRMTEYILDNHFLETLWTVVPLILMLFIFAWGYKGYKEMRRDRPDAYEINVIGKQWLWNMEYTNGRKTLNELYVPKGKAVRLIMTSDDVLHSFFVPNFRLKQDVVPGMYTTITFVATEFGVHPIYCAEYCGGGHSDMLGKVIVLEPADFDKWLQSGKAPANTGIMNAAQAEQGKVVENPVSPAEKGKALYESKGCFACHTTDGTRKIGPSFKGVYGHEVELENGQKVKVDENYIRESIMKPQEKIVKGYPSSMPTFQGLLSEDELNALIAFIKNLKE